MAVDYAVLSNLKMTMVAPITPMSLVACLTLALENVATMSIGAFMCQIALA